VNISHKYVRYSPNSGYPSTQANIVLHFFNEFNFYQHNSTLNVDRNTLDLVFPTLCDISVLPAADPLCACDSFHPALELSLPLLYNRSVALTYEWRLNFRQANYAAINEYLGDILWDEMFCGTDIIETIDVLYHHLGYAINAFVPVYPVRRSSYPAWFSGVNLPHKS